MKMVIKPPLNGVFNFLMVIPVTLLQLPSMIGKRSVLRLANIIGISVALVWKLLMKSMRRWAYENLC